MNTAAIVMVTDAAERLVHTIETLNQKGFAQIIVTEGQQSNKNTVPYLEQAAQLPGCEVLRGLEATGKALKAAFAQYLKGAEDSVGVVTLDLSDKYSPDDVVLCAQELERNPDSLIIGSRCLSEAASDQKHGVTQGLYKITCGVPVSDSHASLRGIPRDFAQKLLSVKGNGSAFGTNMLLETKACDVPIREVSVTTPEDAPPTTFSQSAQDFFWLLFPLLKFSLSSSVSFLVDFGLFALLDHSLKGLDASRRLFIATVGARACSSLFNFTLNRKIVFDTDTSAGGSLLRYAVLCVVQMMCSYGGIYFLSEITPIPTLVVKIIVDFILFCFSFFVQKYWVFKQA